MPAISASAPGKIILFGEHAVVYGRPAIAVPIPQVRAKTIVSAEPRLAGGAVRIQAPAAGVDAFLAELPPDNPLGKAVSLVLEELGLLRSPACTLRVTSTIPVAAGLGSGAAVTVSILRAFSTFLGHPLPDNRVCELSYEVEKLYHGTPSGIDNTVITYASPVFYVKGQNVEMFRARRPFTILIADTGVSSPTKIAVGDVRRLWQQDAARYEALFDAIAEITLQARQALEKGHIHLLGPLMDRNHELLQALSVSSPELDHLVQTACRAGALGAKLSGGGRGGNCIALAAPEAAAHLVEALKAAGAAGVIVAEVK